MASDVLILGEQLDYSNLRDLTNYDIKVKLSDKSVNLITKSIELLEKLNDSENPVYGVSTGFGHLQDKWINKNDQQKLQENLIHSHSAGTGGFIPKEITKTAMILLANSLSKGYSGIRQNTLELIISMINNNIIPVTYQIGSLGASGDLAPLAHVALAFIGEGSVWYNDKIYPTSTIFDQVKLKPIKLQSKEGLALINGTHFVTAYAVHILHKCRFTIINSLISSSLTIEALRGTNVPFNSLFSKVRQHNGHKVVSNAMTSLLQGSQIIDSHKNSLVDHKVQDSYVLRCIPQVVGAIWDSLAYLQKAIEIEINSVTDNPIIFTEESLILSGGNFHAEPLALPLETVNMALIELSNITEGRISRLVNPMSKELKPFLASNAGIESGYMIAHYTVAALLNKIRVLAHPSVTDNIPVSGGQEDHVSMGMNSATKTLNVLEITQEIIANELLMAVRALNFSKIDKSSSILEKIIDFVNEQIPFQSNDHIIREPIQKCVKLIQDNLIYSNFKKELTDVVPQSYI